MIISCKSQERSVFTTGAMGLALHPDLLALGTGDQLAGHLGELLTARNLLLEESP